MLIFIPGADLLKLTRDDVIQICGPADGIRLFNALKGRYVISVKISVGLDSKWIWIQGLFRILFVQLNTSCQNILFEC